MIRWWLVALLSLISVTVQAAPREETRLHGTWRSALFVTDDKGQTPGADGAYQATAFDDATWQDVEVPHNWQGYSYNRQVVRGTLHGVAWYRKTIDLPKVGADERLFLMFEGVNAYATVYLNGQVVGKHGGGLISFTLDMTRAAKPGKNLLVVRAENPDGIKDLPWVPGDDQPENGFAEGSQPLGIFRPVHVIRTNSLRVRPFGAYVWGGPGRIDARRAQLTVRSELQNASDRRRDFTLTSDVIDAGGKVVATVTTPHMLGAGAEGHFEQALPEIRNPHLWSPETPYLYTLRTRLSENGKVVDETVTTTGLRTVEITGTKDSARQLLINGKPFYVHGVAEYEHHLGASQAFTDAQVAARVSMVKAGGFNAFRDAHYPHNLRYQDHFARDGILWWTQFSAHVWFDNDAFRANFKALAADWVRERRNNPALFLWGLQNESKLPPDFAREVMNIIREHDPMASVERLIVSCNGGEGTDWNVPQNWSGTYGGNPDRYAEELKKQGLVGEYGAWRSLGWHAEAPFKGGAFSESAAAALLEKKARQALSVEGQAVGDFHWLLTTHENPGRLMRADGTQIFDGIRPLEQVGPSNNKGLLTLWGEPTDAFYMYRAKTVKEPMVYIVSPTWPDRWIEPGVKSGIEVYSNCDTVELFNDANNTLSLGWRARPADGAPFRWDGVEVRYNRLSAVCRNGGKTAARDLIRLHYLPDAPGVVPLAAKADTRAYLYRVNAGGPDYRDAAGNLWLGDRHWVEGAPKNEKSWGWQSWGDDYPDLDPALGSRRIGYDEIAGTADGDLYRTYRFGRDRLQYRFSVPDGTYEIELHFAEPWYGRAGIDARGWRVFDVAVNGRTVVKNLDLYAEAGFGKAMTKVVRAKAENGELRIHFPRVTAGQAVIAAIAIRGKGSEAPPDGTDLIAGQGRAFLDNGETIYVTGDQRWAGLPPAVLDSDWVPPESASATGNTTVQVRLDSALYLALPDGTASPDGWAPTDLKARGFAFVTRRVKAGETVSVPAALPLLVRRALPLPFAPGVFTFARNKNLYEAETAKLTGAVAATKLKGYAGQAYAAIEANGSAEWSVTTGAASRQAYTFRYQATAPLTARVILTDMSGIEVADLPVTFAVSDGWAEAVIETPSLINAGTYRLSLRVEGAVAVDYVIVK
ncbi:malectin domain-containing carbohydrate-binding protein [Asticcacaulis sp. BYS171W]|uniref:Malectin domain-containing carbohydrate-binding protein n=1 Tax=Asticcacaulis aquaticus TaxID=2984212 RepID=A0ABT5HVQ7_9CAUL|nr:malectin domain-containing carbohydrate-binding protein [Asticcacaulis aquaticus]MDC7684148.1 malectin domain-containing carbohydrate-binding protein [Asticcacaulis aquaticus]